MKKSNIWRGIWVSGIFVILLIIYKLVITYKVEWETRDFNTYLYFYNCGDMICSSVTKPKASYKRIICEDDNCPYVTELYDNIITLTRDNISWLYDYNTGEIFHDEYVNYKLINNNYVVTDNENKQTIMNMAGEIITQNKYDEIIGYDYGMIMYKKDNLLGIDYDYGKKIISPRYEDIIIIDKTMYAARKDNKYMIYNVVNNSAKNNNKYDYIWTNHKLIFTIKDKKIDILDDSLETKLLMQLDTYYDYNTKNEINSLKVHSDDEYIYFNVTTNGRDYNKYKYSIKEEKILLDK